MRARRPLAVASIVVTLAAVPAAMAQSAGDDQYTDPLAGGQSTGGSKGSGGGSKGSGGSSGSSTPAPAPSATPAPAAAQPATSTPAAQAPAQLARTGLDLRLLAALGALLLATGLLLRRSAHGRR